eukprot:g14933.t1
MALTAFSLLQASTILSFKASIGGSAGVGMNFFEMEPGWPLFIIDVAVITMEQQVEASPERLAILIRALHLFRFALN